MFPKHSPQSSLVAHPRAEAHHIRYETPGQNAKRLQSALMLNWEETVEAKKEKKQADMGKHATMNNNGGSNL